MKDYCLFTDSSCDLSPALLNEWGVHSESLTFRFDNDDNEYHNGDMESAIFYQNMRDGMVAKTAAVNVTIFEQAFEALLKKGKDILYIGFSSGLSTTYNSARLAAEELKQKYPESKIYTVDSLSASAGCALLIDAVMERKKNGATIEEARDFAESIKLNVCHWFTVDDLVYLKRGGRVSPTTAFVGNMLGIKPILHVDNDGHLVNVSKARGRRAAITALCDKYGELAKVQGTKAFISHADCIADAELLADMLKEKYGANTELITDVGPVIGAHSGPGTIALFFIGKER